MDGLNILRAVYNYYFLLTESCYVVILVLSNEIFDNQVRT